MGSCARTGLSVTQNVRARCAVLPSCFARSATVRSRGGAGGSSAVRRAATSLACQQSSGSEQDPLTEATTELPKTP